MELSELIGCDSVRGHMIGLFDLDVVYEAVSNLNLNSDVQTSGSF